MTTVHRWTGLEAKLLREALRLSVRDFAAHLGVGTRTVNKWEARLADITQRPHMQEVLDAALTRASDEAQARFAAAVPTHTPAEDSPPPATAPLLGGLLPVLVNKLTGLGVGQAVNRETLAGLLERLVDTKVGPGVVDEWHETAWEYGYRYLSDPREVLLADLAIDLARLELLLADQSDSAARRWLNDVGARLAALLAMTCVDLGYVTEARRAWQLTRRRSGAGAQPETQLWVRGQEAILGLYTPRPLPVVLALAERGLTIRTASPSAGTAVLLAAKAQTLSRQGRGKEALDTLDTLRSAFERLPDTVTACTDSIYGWPERRLCHTASFVHALTGPAPRAHRVHDKALSLLDEAATDRRCQIDMHRATRLVRDGHVTEGVTHAATSLQSVPPQRQGTFVLALAAGVFDHVPTTAISHAAVVRYREQLATAGHRRSAGATGA